MGVALVTLLAMSTGRRCTESDKIQCGENENLDNDSCVCSTGYVRSYTGKCDQCDQGFLQSSDGKGKLVCVSASDDKRALDEDFKKNNDRFLSAMSSDYNMSKTNAMFRGYPIFKDSNVRSADQFENEGMNIPGIYPSFNSYKQAEFSSLGDIIDMAKKESERKDWTPYLNKTSIKTTPLRLNETRYANYRHSKSEGGGGILDFPFVYGDGNMELPPIDSMFKIDETIQENPGVYPNNRGQVEYAPKKIANDFGFKPKTGKFDRTILKEEPEEKHILKREGLQDVAADYALSSMGLKFNNPAGQMTSFAHGDVMTSYKPINEIMRPIAMPILTNRQGERENDYIANATSEVLAPPIPIEELRLKRKNGEELGLIPYPTGGSYVPENPRGEIPQRDVGDTLEIWNAANPFYPISGEYNSRRETIFRNKREPIIPNTKGHGFFGEFLDPMKDITNSDKFFYVGGDGMRDVTSRDDRNNERILVDPRPGLGQIEGDQVRTIPVRETSNKASNFYMDMQNITYMNLPKEQPLRQSQITSNNQRYDGIKYEKPFILPPSHESREILQIGLPLSNA